MGPENIGDLSDSQIITGLLALVMALVAWIFNRELNRVNTKVQEHDVRLNNHSGRLASLDGKTENE